MLGVCGLFRCPTRHCRFEKFGHVLRVHVFFVWAELVLSADSLAYFASLSDNLSRTLDAHRSALMSELLSQLPPLPLESPGLFCSVFLCVSVQNLLRLTAPEGQADHHIESKSREYQVCSTRTVHDTLYFF